MRKKRENILQAFRVYKIYSTLAETFKTFNMITNKDNFCVIMVAVSVAVSGLSAAKLFRNNFWIFSAQGVHYCNKHSIGSSK